MTRKLLLCILLIFSFVAYKAQSQSRKFEDILKFKLRGSGEILEDHEVRGYFMFYQVDKVSKGTFSYMLRILDENLQDYKTTTLEEGKHVSLIESVYNGDAIMLKFVDFKAKKLIFMTYSKQAELLDRTERPADKMELYFYRNAVAANQEVDLLADVTGKGFADYAVVDKGKGYNITFISSSEGQKGWTKAAQKTAKVEAAVYLCNSDNKLFNLVMKRPSLTSNKVDYAINAYDLATGNRVFETTLKSNKYSAEPLRGYYDADEQLLNVIGVFYEPDVKTVKDNGLGLFNYKIDNSGKIVSEKYLLWAKDFRNFVTVDNDGRISNEKKNGFIYFHNVIQNPDGSIIAVGEQYKKAADAAGIAARALGGNAGSTVKMVINDMIIFHFSKEFDIKSVEFIEKTKSDFSLPSGYGFVNIHMLSKMVKAYGGFDYAFTTKSKEKGTVSVGYVDYQKNKGAKNEFVFGASTYYDGKFTNDKISLGKPRGGDKLRVLRGKPGYVVIMSYDRKEKTIEVRQESINY